MAVKRTKAKDIGDLTLANGDASIDEETNAMLLGERKKHMHGREIQAGASHARTMPCTHDATHTHACRHMQMFMPFRFVAAKIQNTFYSCSQLM